MSLTVSFRNSIFSFALVLALMANINSNGQIVINEVLVNPSSSATDQTFANCTTTTDGLQWVELFNTSKCDTIDLGCYVLASYTSSSNNGSLSIPGGIKILPQGFLLIGGANVPGIDLLVSSYCNSTELCGSGNWSLPIDNGWVALYKPSGTVSDAVFWTSASGQPGLLGSNAAYSGKPCYPPTNICTNHGTLKAASTMTPGTEILYVGKVAGLGKSMYRSVDGHGGWLTDGTPTPKNCNSNCLPPSDLTATLDTNQKETCKNSNGRLSVAVTGGSAPYTYLWNNQSKTSFIDSLKAGTYSVTVIDDSNCHVTLTDTLPGFGDSVLITLTPKTVTVFEGDTVRLTASSTATIFKVQWSPTDGLSCINCTDPIAKPREKTFYVITITDIYGCIGTDTAEVDLLKDENSVFIPNAFTPDASFNNRFYVRSAKITAMNIHIFDRWGKEVFSAFDQTTPWNGIDKNGLNLAAGVYTYYVQATFLNGTTRIIDGNVTLLR